MEISGNGKWRRLSGLGSKGLDGGTGNEGLGARDTTVTLTSQGGTTRVEELEKALV